jgi:hypothetical protein
MARAEALYPITLVIRAFFLACMSAFFSMTRDPLFLVLLGIVGFGFVLTGLTYLRAKAPLDDLSAHAPKWKFETLPESLTEGSKSVRHLPRYLSIERDPEFFSTYHHEDHVSRQLSPRRHQFSNC